MKKKILFTITLTIILLLAGCSNENKSNMPTTINEYKIIKISHYSFRGFSERRIYVTQNHGVFELKCFSVPSEGFNEKFFKEGKVLKLKSDIFYKNRC